MKTTCTALTFFFLSLCLNSSSDVWAKLRNSGEDNRELSHKSSRNYFQSKLKNKWSGKCIGFDVANDVDNGEKAKWVNCKRAPTFVFQNPNQEYFQQKPSDDERKVYNGIYYHLAFMVGSLSESSSTSDHRSYMCLSVDTKKKFARANYCSSSLEQWWYPIAVRGKPDTYRLFNAKTKNLLEYKSESRSTTSWNTTLIKDFFDGFFSDKAAFIEGSESDGHRRRMARARALNDLPDGYNITAETAAAAAEAQTEALKTTSTNEELEDALRGKVFFDQESSVISNNGTIYDNDDDRQYFVDLDCRFVFGEDPIRDDGWYNGRDPSSTKPPEEES